MATHIDVANDTSSLAPLCGAYQSGDDFIFGDCTSREDMLIASTEATCEECIRKAREM